ncbi:MAG: ribonuclease P protein component [Ruminococcaceae bacterium]|nr:ribonuclease P protein component [Oscillospiraceae bacterium]
MSKQKAAVLNQNKDFRTLYYRGRSQVSPFLVMYVRKNKLGICRVGITTGKKIGKAVQRNRCRRLIREAYRLLRPAIKGHWDIVFVARVRTATASMHQVKKAMEEQFRALSMM